MQRCDRRRWMQAAAAGLAAAGCPSGWRKLRFAAREEVLETTGLAPGAIPPFGSLFGLPTICDERLGNSDVINFNAGDHSISVSVRYADYVLVEKPELGTFAE